MRRAAAFGIFVALASGLGPHRAAFGDVTVQPAPAVSTSSGVATADATDSGANARVAKEHYVRGLEFVKRGELSAALAEFLASRDLRRTGSAAMNAAYCLRQLGRLSEALALYTETLRDHGPTLKPEHVAYVTTSMRELEAALGSIRVETSVPAATVLIDGEDRGTTPLSSGVRVNPGLHVVRVVKEGYEPVQATVSVASGQSKTLNVRLIQLSQAGRLFVHEANARTIDLWIDGLKVGKTPWQGLVPLGSHTIKLESAERIGTAPVTARVRSGEVTQLTLRAIPLGARVRIEPHPVHARLTLDGVSLGAGVWQGDLPAGHHDLVIEASGYVTASRRVAIRPGGQTLRIELHPSSASRRLLPNRFAVELSGGFALTHSLGSGADASCAHRACPDRPLVLGALGSLRTGYRWTNHLTAEVAVGYLRLWRDLPRRIRLTDPTTGDVFSSGRMLDQTRVSMPFVAVGVSRSFFDRTPLTARLSSGLGRAHVATAVLGSFEREGTPEDDTEYRLSLLEHARSVWVPFLAPELRFGYRFSREWTFDLGVTALILFAPSYARTGLSAVPEDQQARWVLLSGERGDLAGPVRLPVENALGTSLTWVPSLAVRWEF